MARKTSPEAEAGARTGAKTSPARKTAASRSLNRQILGLALPSLATLIVEPLLLLVDSALVGHLGEAPLAGLTLASTILTTVVGLCIFLAYTTTSSVAQAWGRGEKRAALHAGVDALWFAIGIGLVLAVGMTLGASAIISWFSPAAAAAAEAEQYLRASAWGVPGMLAVLAANGTLRGLGDTRSAMYATTLAALANAPLSWALIYPSGWGIAGAGFATALCQTAMGLWLAAKMLRRAHQVKAPLGPSGAGFLRTASDSWPLLTRTLLLRVVLLLQVFAATSFGQTPLAAHQIVLTLWNFAGYGLDSLATASQILVAQEVGNGDRERLREIINKTFKWALGAGIVLGIALAALAPLLVRLITNTPAVQTYALHTLWVVSVLIPIAAVAYLFDGVLMGAAQMRRLAAYMLISLLVYAPAMGLVMWGANQGVLPGQALSWLWLVFGIAHMGVRALTTWRRTRLPNWLD